MPRRASKNQESEDATTIALRVVETALGESLVPPKKNPHAVALSQLGASKGGKARAAKLSSKRRVQIAVKAAQVRWETRRKKAD